jgi:hypothetical protein
MSFGDFTGVFSRDFVVGFFLPAFAALFALWLSASSELVPNLLEQHSKATQLLILGGFAVIVGLLLSGLSYSVAWFFEGYPLERRSSWPVVGTIYRVAIAGQRKRYDRLVSTRDDGKEPDENRQDAAWDLARYFPPSREGLLPTRLGNAIRAFEQHSNVVWGLDSVTIWPRIEALLSAEERELLVDSKVNFNLFLNAAVVALGVGACLVIDQAVFAPLSVWWWPLYAIPFALAYVLYRLAVGPATEWGDAVRSSIDLHRLELYEKLGVRAPTSFSDEQEIALEVNQALLYRGPLSDDIWRSKTGDAEDEGEDASCVRRWLGLGRRKEANRE